MSMTQPVSIPEMVNQSRAIISSPSVATFERYERHGTLTNALIYVGIAALISGVLGLVNGFGGLISGVVLGIAGFVVFSGLVFWIGKRFFNGTGNWDEVAYTFSLFWAPLMVVGGVLTLLSVVPILGFLAGLASIAMLFVQVYFGYLAVQSSMNITDQGRAIGTLALAFVGTIVFYALIGVLLAPLYLLFW